jgi:hypothetical protein
MQAFCSYECLFLAKAHGGPVVINTIVLSVIALCTTMNPMMYDVVKGTIEVKTHW